MQSMILALTLQMFFPIFENPGQFTSLSLVNTSSTAAEFTVRLNSAEGGQTNVFRIPIQAGSQRAVSVDQLRTGPSAPLSGWVHVEATTDDFTGYLVAGTGELLGGIEPASRPALMTYLPHVRVRVPVSGTVPTDTAIAVVNPSETPANVTMSFVTYGQVLMHTAFLQVPARGSRVFRASEFLAGGSIPFDGRVIVRSFVPIAAWQQVETPLALSTLRGRISAEFDLTTSMRSPFFVFGGNLQSILTLWNPIEPAVTVEAAAYDPNGMLLGERVQLTLEPGQAISVPIEQILRIPTAASFPGQIITGSLWLREIGNKPFRVLANIEVSRFDSQSLVSSMLYWLNSSASDVWEIPYVAGNERYFTAYSVMAANELSTSPTNVTIEVHNVEGIVVQRIARTLSPRSFEAALISPPVPGAYIRIWSNQPVVVLGTVGTHDGRLVESIAAVR